MRDGMHTPPAHPTSREHGSPTTGSEQPRLFDASTTERPTCPTCGARAKNACAHDGDIAHGLKEPLARRPRGCIAAYNPHTAPIPF